MNIINLSSNIFTPEESQVLSLGLSFCPNKTVDNFEAIKDIHLFARKPLFKSLYGKETKKEDSVALGLKAADFRALRDLNLFLQENGSCKDVWEADFDCEEDEEEPRQDPPPKKTFKS